VGSEDGRVHAVDRMSGEALWRFGTGGKIYGTPQVSDGRVFVGSEDQHVYAIDAAGGHQIWQASVAGAVTASLSVANGQLYAATRAGSINTLDLANGRLAWRFEAPKAADPANGRAIPGIRPLVSFVMPPAVEPDFLYVGDTNGRLYKIRNRDG
jgi:outer membrane protein assembly factor BamB